MRFLSLTALAAAFLFTAEHADATVIARQHHIGEVDRLLSRRGDIDDPRRRAFLEQRQQETGQKKAR